MVEHAGATRAPITREERVDTRRDGILTRYEDHLADFIGFVLGQYVTSGVTELDSAKLPELLALRYKTLVEARKSLGDTARIRSAFVGFQKGLF